MGTSPVWVKRVYRYGELTGMGSNGYVDMGTSQVWVERVCRYGDLTGIGRTGM